MNLVRQIVTRPIGVSTLGESLSRALVKREKRCAVERAYRYFNDFDMSKGKQSLSAIYRRGCQLIECAHGARVLDKIHLGKGKQRYTRFIILQPSKEANYIQFVSLKFKPPKITDSDERFTFKVTSHALERLLAANVSQREVLRTTFTDTTKLFCPDGKRMSEFLRQRLPSTFHLWIFGAGESRCTVELDASGKPLMTLKTFIPEANLRGWSRAQYNNAKTQNTAYKLKPYNS